LNRARHAAPPRRTIAAGIATMPVTISGSKRDTWDALAVGRRAGPTGESSSSSTAKMARHAIGVMVRCDDEANAREQALSKLQGFLSEAFGGCRGFTPSTLSPRNQRRRRFAVYRLRAFRLTHQRPRRAITRARCATSRRAVAASVTTSDRKSDPITTCVVPAVGIRVRAARHPIRVVHVVTCGHVHCVPILSGYAKVRHCVVSLR
jgi:hypothetical protein